MMQTIAEYVLLFFFYSAIGWLSESIFCSLPAKRWINRGFLTGPITPIYGTGALVIFVLLSPLKSNPILVFFVGMIACNVVEYFTSFAMEKLFNARWWDYSNKFLNLNGRICFSHSIIWGSVSVLFLYVVHPKIGGPILNFIPTRQVYTVLAIILVLFALDLANAVRKALDIGKILAKIDSLWNAFSSKKEELDAGGAPIVVTEKLRIKSREFMKQVKDFQEATEKLLTMRRREKKRDKELDKLEKQQRQELRREESQRSTLQKYPYLKETIESQLHKLEGAMEDVYDYARGDSTDKFPNDEENDDKDEEKDDKDEEK